MRRNKIFERDNLQTLKISETVSYQYRMVNGKNYSEGLIASGRYYPCVKMNDRFYFGIHRNERFVPGIIWNQSFIPGIVTKSGFFPGIATDSGFQFGIIAFGAFISGIIVGNNFVPGLARDNHFIPGCYTNQGDFALGRVFRRSFDSGVVDSRTRNFIFTDHEAIRTKVASSLVKEGFGISNVRRYEAIGGIPIAGMIKGAFHEDICICSSGIMTSKWMIIGGLPYNTNGDGISFDKKYLPHADQLSDIIEALGGDTSGLSDVGWASRQDEWENLANGLTEGRPGNAFGSAVDNFQDILINGLNALGKGTSDLIDGLNRDYEEYWGNMIAGIQGAGGMTHGDGGGGAGGAGGGTSVSKSDDKMTDSVVVFKGGPTLILLILLEFIFRPGGDTSLKEVNPPSQPSGGSPSPDVSGDDEGGVSEGNVIVGGTKGLRPIEVKDPSKKESGIKVVQTDTGAIMVVDYDQLRDATANGPEEGMIIGLSPLTGETINVIPGKVDPKARFGQLLKQWYLNPIINPIR